MIDHKPRRIDTVTAIKITRSLLTLCLTAMTAVSVSAAPNAKPPRPIHDPRYGKALYDFYQEHYFNAITDITAARARSAIKGEGHDPELLLGSLYLSYGMEKAAADIFKRLLDGNLDPYSHDLAWFYLGRMRYDDGRYGQALQALGTVRDALPVDKNGERLYLMVNGYLHENDYLGATRLVQNEISPRIWDYYARYNLGIALLRARQSEQGLRFLEQVARLTPRTEEESTLKDKANIAIGYASLRSGAGGDPIAAFSSVRLNGPASNQALLGSGWAYSAAGKPNEALKPWMALSSRSSTDLTAQQALIAIAYTFEQLQQRQLALSYYAKAISAYDRVRTAITKAISSTDYAAFLKSTIPFSLAGAEAWSGASTAMNTLPGAQYLHELLTSPEFRRAYREYRDLDYLRIQVTNWKEKIPLLRTMLAERRRQYTINIAQVKDSQYAQRLGALKQKREVLAKRIADIEDHEAFTQLVTVQESQRLAQFANITARLNRLAARGVDVSSETKDYHILSGLTQWQIATQYPARLWRVKKSLRQLDRALAEAARAKTSLEDVVKISPLNFAGFAQRITVLDRHLTGLAERLSAASDRQLQNCNQLIVTALNEKRRRVDEQRDRALYAQARLYDQLSHEPASHD